MIRLTLTTLLILLARSVTSTIDRSSIKQFIHDIKNREFFGKLCTTALAEDSVDTETCHLSEDCNGKENSGLTSSSISNENDVSDLNVWSLLQKEFPWLKMELVKSYKGSARRKGHGYVFVKLNTDELLGACLQHGRFFGPSVQVVNGNLWFHKDAKMRKFGSFTWVFGLSAGIFRDDKNRVFVISTNPDCPDVDITRAPSQLWQVEVTLTRKPSGIPIPVIKEHHPNKTVSLNIPPHILNDETFSVNKNLIMEGLISLSCSNANRKTFQTIANKESYKLAIKSSKRELSSYWDNILGDDPECSEFASVWLPDLSLFKKTTLSCFPGSGSKWLVELIEFSTGITTGLHSKQIPRLLTKTHHDSNDNINSASRNKILRSPQWHIRLENLWASEGRGILLIRNPYEAIVSWWHHIQSGNTMKGESDPRHLKKTLKTSSFCSFAISEIRMWKLLILDWLTLTPDLMIVHYEKMKVNYVREVRRVLSFLKLPLDKKRQQCLEKYPANKFKRKNSVQLTKDMFCEQAVKMIDEAIEEVDQSLDKHHFEALPTHLYSTSKDDGKSVTEITVEKVI